MNQKRRIGLLGGTFDPIHIGHLLLAECAREQFHLDYVYVMPNGKPDYKGHDITRADHRIQMIKAAIKDNPNLKLFTLETKREGFTYTYETMEYLTKEHPNYDYYFIIGADSLFYIEKWKHPERFFPLCTFLVANRDQSLKEDIQNKIKALNNQFHGTIYEMDYPRIDISSSMIRKKVAKGESVRYLIPEESRIYLEKHHLYQEENQLE